MTATRAERQFVRWIVAAIVTVLLVAYASSCGGMRKTLYTSAGAAGGALLGSTLGPGGTAAGAALGAGGTQAFVENQELRDGDLVGGDALETQNKELRKMVAALGGKVAAYESEGILAWVKRWVGRIVLVLGLGWLAWNGAKLLMSPRGREAREKLGWIRGLFAADGLRHTR